MDPALFRACFPVLGRRSYLNAGTCGPIPAAAAEAAAAAAAQQAAEGRSGEEHLDRMRERWKRMRAGYARWLGCASAEVALTRCTTDGVNTVLDGMGLRRGEEVLTSDEEHPGVLAPLASARARHGIEVRVVPFAQLADAVTQRTRLVACSHVSWVTGRVVDAPALAQTGALVLLDGAQGLGALPLEMEALGCDFYAASGQKWLCGPEGSGCLYVSRERIEELVPPWPGYPALEDPRRGLELDVHPGARRFDLSGTSADTADWALASLAVLEEPGREWIAERGTMLAELLAAGLRERGARVAERGRSTLVSWESEEPEAEVERLASESYLVRAIPGHGLVRASVGAWSSEEELERLAELAA